MMNSYFRLNTVLNATMAAAKGIIKIVSSKTKSQLTRTKGQSNAFLYNLPNALRLGCLINTYSGNLGFSFSIVILIYVAPMMIIEIATIKYIGKNLGIAPKSKRRKNIFNMCVPFFPYV
jgi:hypothetical protein